MSLNLVDLYYFLADLSTGPRRLILLFPRRSFAFDASRRVNVRCKIIYERRKFFVLSVSFLIYHYQQSDIYPGIYDALDINSNFKKDAYTSLVFFYSLTNIDKLF